MGKGLMLIKKGGHLQGRAAAPASPESGDFYFNNVDDKFYFYQESEWKSVGGVGNALQFSKVEDILRTATNTLIADLTVLTAITFKEIIVEVTEVFDGTPTLTIGTPADNDLLFLNSDVDLSKLGIYKIEVSEKFLASAEVRAYIASGGTTGKINVTLVYFGS